MSLRACMLVVFIGATFTAPELFAQLQLGRGTAVIQVVTVPTDSTARFSFTGVADGTISTGQRLEATGLLDGEHTATQRDPGLDFVLTDISCDDSGSNALSSGNVATRTATFRVDQGETVTCTFTNTASEMVSESGGGSAGSAGGAAASVNPFEEPDEAFDEFPIPDDVPSNAGTFPAPKAGPWDVQNFAGQMSCGGFGMPLRPDRGRGDLEVLDNGRTVIGTGLGEDSAPLRMTAVSGISGRYAGSMGGERDGIPMTIDFYWQMITDEWITGYLTSTVSQQGVRCNMFRTFELEYAGP